MAVKRTGLGKGLDSLIPEKAVASEETKINSEQLIKINLIEPNRDQPRKIFEEDEILELADSIKKVGVLSPLLVQKRKDYYEIIAGERRWRASKEAGLKEIPVIVKNYTEEEIVVVSIIENLQRVDLNPIEKAKAYKKLVETFSLKQDEVAERVSKSRAEVTNYMRLLKLNPKVQQLVSDKLISTGHARALLAIEDEEQQCTLAYRALDESLSVREIEKIIKSMKAPKKDLVKKEIKNKIIYQDLENRLEQVIGTKVNIQHKESGKGKIEIEYYSEKELEQMFDRLLSLRDE